MTTVKYEDMTTEELLQELDNMSNFEEALKDENRVLRERLSRIVEANVDDEEDD